MAVRVVQPVQSLRDQFIDQLMNAPKIDQNAVSNFVSTPNPTTQGLDISFSIVNEVGIGSVSLLRAYVLDIAQATVLQTWTGSQATFTWSDTDKGLQQVGQVYYWIRLEPKSPSSTAKEVTVGPQNVLLNPSLLPPLPLALISASHAAAVNGTTLITINVASIPQGDSIKIYVTGYQGNTNPVAVAQSTVAPLQFTLKQTGELLTFTAIAVSPGGVEATSGPTCTLLLSNFAIAPAQIQNVQAVQISTGNQVSWPASLDQGVDSYSLYRGQAGFGFSNASLLATVSTTDAGTVLYLDTGGLTGSWEYYVTAHNPSGNSTPSVAAAPVVVYSSSSIPPNGPTNTNNNATVDSIDAGTSATVRIYGPGGVGTGYVHYTGYGTVNRFAGTITGLAYATSYYIMWHANLTPGGQYMAITTFLTTLPDGYEWVGQVKTVSAGGAGGTSGGGGQVGPQGGCVEEGTLVVAPEGTVSTLEPCSDWIVLDLGEGPLKMHPDTLVSVWKKAKHLQKDDQIEVEGARWKKPQGIWQEYRHGIKVKRTCPGGTYHAGPSMVRLHNVKQLNPLP